MRERNHSGNRAEIETTLWELVADAISEVASSDEEAFAVLETIPAEGGISVHATPRLWAA